ncbi:hypothetical protein GALL_536680 [mine drainage metagenome]|uniref:Uncharacterized protein n=1 Tax=mine drainage metagenome TaxID=410659 RepID=A0A1J5PHM5_9ZZZZ
MRPDQRQRVAQHPAKALIKLAAFYRLAAIQGNGFAVFAHPHHVMPKVGFQTLLLKVELDL